MRPGSCRRAVPKPEIQDVYAVTTLEQAGALLNPLRAEILAALREPGSAGEVARRLGDVPQKINYHVKELERVGLVRRVATRRRRNLVGVLLVTVAERLRRDALALLEQAEGPGQVPSLTLTATLDLPDEAARHAFAEDYLRALAELTRRHGARGAGSPGTGTPGAPETPGPSGGPRPGVPMRLVVACYPDPSGTAGLREEGQGGAT